MFRIRSHSLTLFPVVFKRSFSYPLNITWRGIKDMSREDVVKWLDSPDMRRIQMSKPMLQKWSDQVATRYSEQWRHYHTLNHLSDMMNHLQTWRDSIKDATSVILAILFHDIVYDPKSSTNEDDSVKIFNMFADDVQLTEEMSAKTTQLITATIKHLPDTGSDDSDHAFFLDFDMAILGQTQQVYDVYTANIQKEYCHMNATDFCKGRAKVLETFLQRPRIYATRELHQAFEEQARQNMQREIEMLKNPVQATE